MEIRLAEIKIISNGMVSYFTVSYHLAPCKNILGRNNPRHCLIQRIINPGEAGQCISREVHLQFVHCIHMQSISFSSSSVKLELQIRQFQSSLASFSTSHLLSLLIFSFCPQLLLLFLRLLLLFLLYQLLLFLFSLLLTYQLFPALACKSKYCRR